MIRPRLADHGVRFPRKRNPAAASIGPAVAGMTPTRVGLGVVHAVVVRTASARSRALLTTRRRFGAAEVRATRAIGRVGPTLRQIRRAAGAGCSVRHDSERRDPHLRHPSNHRSPPRHRAPDAREASVAPESESRASTIVRAGERRRFDRGTLWHDRLQSPPRYRANEAHRAVCVRRPDLDAQSGRQGPNA